MTTYLIPWLPEKQTVSYEWKTDVMTGADGTETRPALWARPSVTLSLEYSLLGDDIAAAALPVTRSMIVNDPGLRIRVPMRHRALFLDDDVASGAAVLVLDYDRSVDWARPGATLYVEVNENEDGYAAIVSMVAHVADTLEVTVDTAAPSDLFAVSCRVSPTALLQPKDKQALGLYRVEQGTWSVAGSVQEFDYGSGTGITLPINGEGFLVWDKPALQDGEAMIAEEFDAGLDPIGDVLTEGTTLFPKSRIRRDLTFSVDGLDEWRRFEAFLYSVRGQQVPFLRPTFRDDLILIEQPASPTAALIVDEDPDYRPWIAGADTFRRLALTMSDGTISAVGVASVVDNLDGTHTVNLTSAFTRGILTIRRVSFLEATRLASDIVTLAAVRGLQSVLSLQTLTGDFCDQVLV